MTRMNGKSGRNGSARRGPPSVRDVSAAQAPVVVVRASGAIVAVGKAIAAAATLGYGGMLLGPVAVGFVAHITNLPISFSMLAVLAVGSSLLGSLCQI